MIAPTDAEFGQPAKLELAQQLESGCPPNGVGLPPSRSPAIGRRPCRPDKLEFVMFTNCERLSVR